ncbi:class I SAM-dependent methyltransferase [Maridesulfovibrio sp.]|uniref:class I SAM-dependent methyltransferase n=1 Tax=Maridesulfovibrio sp. TaxID=2795000 RepID=UPI0029C9E177|nr:class I SAM-dependent methyltransferase [Maridesulfovibrio sp.]
MTTPQILDPACGSKMFYFDKETPLVHFCDIRDEEHPLCDGRLLKVHPDQVADFRDLPHEDESFHLIIFDPPHLERAGPKSWQAAKYGKLNKETWREDLAQGFSECWRVLAGGGTMIFKWNETQIKVNEILACFSQRPICGHRTTQNLKTHWIVFYKPVVGGCDG